MAKWLTTILLFGALAASAQVLQPIDPNKRADDISNKSAEFPNVNLGTLPQPTRQLSRSPLTDKQQRFSDVNLKTVDLNTLQFSTVPTKTLPQTNFTAKRAVEAEKARLEQRQQVKTSKAEINNREIRPYGPGGEEELKKQLGTPP